MIPGPLLIFRLSTSSENTKPCGSNWVKIKGAQLKINVTRPIVH